MVLILWSKKRGLVPSLKYNGDIITESAVVSQFLADAHPSHLLPASNGATNALYRARVNFFADTFISKLLPHIFPRAQTEAERDAAGEELVKIVVKEMEPLFTWDQAKGSFFEGSERVTLAEVRARGNLEDPSPLWSLTSRHC